MVETHRFAYSVPKDLADFNPDDFIVEAEAWLNEYVKTGERIAISVSGGVDSTVAAHLLHRVAGDDVYPFFLDDGCRRLIEGRHEGEVTQRIFKDFKNFERLDAEDVIKPKLIGLSDGEEKRKAFIAAYRDVSNNHIKDLDARWIADGTIAPDIAETEGNYKSQHNVGWNYAIRKLEVLAPLAKPHVRKVGAALGLPAEFVHRIPCPGPAQIIRTVGTFTQEKLRIAQVATDLVEQAVDNYYMQKFGKPYVYDAATGVRTPFQYFGVALDADMKIDNNLTDLAKGILKTRLEGYVMTAQTTVVPQEGKRPDKPIYRPVAWLRTADDIGYAELEKLSREAWDKLQLPRILYHVYGRDGSPYVVGIRAIESVAAAEAKPVEFEHDYLRAVGRTISDMMGIAQVAYDISFKPPATIEFE